MNFKIEINYLNIDNYPSVERHLEEMAQKGWMLNKVLLGVLFIYKKIEPQDLDFSITPYEFETALTRKTKADLEEIQSVSKDVGWEFAAKSYDLQIYYKSSHTYAIPLQTDEEEEFNTLEIIANRYLKSQYFLIVLLLILSWFNIGRQFTSVDAMKDGYGQIVALLLPVTVLLSIIHVIDLKRFLKLNKKNVELGAPLEFNDSKRGVYQILYKFILFLFFALIVYALFSVFNLKNTAIILGILPVAIGVGIGFLGRLFIKPSQRSKGFKVMAIGVMLTIAAIVGGATVFINLDFLVEDDDEGTKNEYAILTFDDTPDNRHEDGNHFERNASFLIPESYDYVSISGDYYLTTEHSKTLTESIAEKLVQRYIEEAKNSARGNFAHDFEWAVIIGNHENYLRRAGFSEDEIRSLSQDISEENVGDKIDQGMETAIQNAITIDEGLWGFDEVYYLTYAKDEMVIRKENEVYYLWGFEGLGGFNFSNPIAVENIKEQLQLD